jgi:hypothetical protein
MQVRWIGVGLLVLALAGCGSSYTDSLRSDVASMRTTLQTYNTAHPASLQATGTACKSAYDGLGGHAPGSDKGSPPRRYVRVVHAVQAAYREARSGFRDCAAAAATDNYPKMAAAQAEIAQANARISLARKLDRP